jgi:cytoskeletal protein CcmA (bactofilin family)
MSGGKSMFSKSGGSGNPTLPSPSEEISAYLGKETVFQGKMTFEGVFRLDGRFEGEIFDSGTLIVGETANIKGKIGLQTLIINGRVDGDVYAKARVEIHATGKVYGTLSAPILIINEGGIFEGSCKMEGGMDKKEDHPDLPSQNPDLPPSSFTPKAEE